MNYAVIADNGGSDQKYRDIVGEVYTFPSMYANILTEGVKFVYQRCSVSSMRVAEPDKERLLNESHYFGTAEIGKVKYIGENLYEAEIINYKHFNHGVPFRLKDGSHFELLPGYFWRNGVRCSQKEVYDEISKAGFGTIPTTTPLVGVKPQENLRNPIWTNNKRKTAKNHSSVQIKKDLIRGVSSKTFSNDTLQIVTDRTGYWLYDIVSDTYYLLANIGGNRFDAGEIKIMRGLISKNPIIYDNKRFGITHDDGYDKLIIGSLEITDECIIFRGNGPSVKTIQSVKIPITL